MKGTNSIIINEMKNVKFRKKKTLSLWEIKEAKIQEKRKTRSVKIEDNK
jgi:hypothetical protein